MQLPDAGEVIKVVESSEMFQAARDTFYSIPFWLRALIFCFVLGSAILSKWILPAITNLIRAKKGS